jgi:hypothetical protein
VTPEEVEAKNNELRAAFRVAFGSPAGQAVLADLAPFCKAAEPCFDPDPRIHARFEGRREVWLRIQQFFYLTDQDILELALRRPRLKPAGDSDA